MNERQKLLARLDALETQRCKNCHKHNYNAIDVHCTCPAAVEIRQIGKQLLGSRKRSVPVSDGSALIEQFAEEMTVDVYRQLREKNYSIMRIATEAKIPKTRLHQWRQENGFVHTEKMVKRDIHKRESADSDYTKYRKLAKANGISNHTYYHRVKISGWDYERAATEKVQKQVHKRKARA